MLRWAIDDYAPANVVLGRWGQNNINEVNLICELHGRRGRNVSECGAELVVPSSLFLRPGYRA